MATDSNIGTDPSSLLRRVERNVANAATDGRVLNDLLDEFHRGFPTDHLRRLLHSPDAPVVRAGAWLLSELGSRGCSVFRQVPQLLDSGDPSVRFSLTDCIVVCATESDGELVAKVVSLLEDPDRSVRWKALDSLTKIDDKALVSAHNWLSDHRREWSARVATACFLPEKRQDARAKLELIADERQSDVTSSELKLYVVVAIREGTPLPLLRTVAEIAVDDDLREFLEDFPDI